MSQNKPAPRQIRKTASKTLSYNCIKSPVLRNKSIFAMFDRNENKPDRQVYEKD